MSVKKSSFKFINSLNTKCPGCNNNEKNRLAHMIPGGCMSKIESGVEWVQDPVESEESDSQETEEDRSGRTSFSTYSQYEDIEKNKEEEKDDSKNKHDYDELMFHMDDVEDHVPQIVEYDFNNPCKWTK